MIQSKFTPSQSFAAAMLCTSMWLSACGQTEEAASRVSLPLVSTTESGDTYVLENVQVEIRQGTTVVTTLVGDDTDPNETVLTADLDAGDYTAELAEGWQLMREESDGSRVAVEATLRGEAVRTFSVANASTVTLTYVFQTAEGQVAFGGSVEIGFEVQDGPVPTLPTTSEACPTLDTGTVNVLGQDVQLWVGEPQPDALGPVFFYWHGTGSVAGEVTSALGSGFDAILARGGMIASFTTSTGNGSDTSGTGTWSAGDFAMADVLLACANEQLNIDTRRIYTGGCSAGGLHVGAMVYARSSYLAGAMPNSGGILPSQQQQLQDPSHVPSVISTHGAPGVDAVVIDFSNTSAALNDDVASRGGYVVNCNHGGSTCGRPTEVRDAQWEFLMDHPFGVSPDPYASGLPSSFPSSCTIVSP